MRIEAKANLLISKIRWFINITKIKFPKLMGFADKKLDEVVYILIV